MRWASTAATASCLDTTDVSIDQVGVVRLLVGVGDPGERADDPRARLRVQPLAVACLAYLKRRRHVHEHEVARLRDHLAHPGAGRRVRGDRRADGDPAMPRDLGGHVPDAGDVQVPVLPREREPGGEQPPHQVAVEQRHGTVAALEQRVAQVPGERGLPGTRQPGEEHDDAAPGARRPGPAQLLSHAGGHQPGGHLVARVEQLAELAVRQVAPLEPGLDQAERPPDLGRRVVGPLAFRQDLDAELGQIKISGIRTTSAYCSLVTRID